MKLKVIGKISDGDVFVLASKTMVYFSSEGHYYDMHKDEYVDFEVGASVPEKGFDDYYFAMSLKDFKEVGKMLKGIWHTYCF